MFKIKFLEIINDKLDVHTGYFFKKRHYVNIIFSNHFGCWVFSILLCVFVELESKTYPMAITILKMHTFCVKGIEFSIIIKLTSIKKSSLFTVTTSLQRH